MGECKKDSSFSYFHSWFLVGSVIRMKRGNTKNGESNGANRKATKTPATNEPSAADILAAVAARQQQGQKKPVNNKPKRFLGRISLILICMTVFLGFYFGRDLLLAAVTRLDDWLGEDDSSSTPSKDADIDQNVNTTANPPAKKDKKNKLPPWANKKGAQSIPDYDTYVKYAVEQGWQPTDPVDKLTDTIRKFPQIFDLVEGERALRSTTKKSTAVASKDGSTTTSTSEEDHLFIEEEDKIDEYLEILQEETKFLLKILMKSSDVKGETTSKLKKRDIDLTDTLHSTLDMMNQCYYRLMKRRIQLNNPRYAVTFLSLIS